MTDESLVENLTFRIHHTMLPVADLDRSVGFYMQLLGMKLKERHVNEVRKVAVALVGYGDKPTSPFLELIENLGDSAPTAVTPLNAHIAIDVSDLRKLSGILEREGITFVRPLKARSDGKGLSAWVQDPDGHEIELAERYSD